MSDEERGESQRAVLGNEAAGGAHVVFVSAIEAFDELLEGTKFGGDRVEVFQADDLPQGVRGLRRGAVSVEEVHPGLISGVAIGDEAEGLIWGQGAGGLTQGHRSGQGIALCGDVIGRDVMPLGVEKEEGVLVLARDTNIGFIPGGSVAERSLVGQVKGVAVVGRGLSVVEDGLITEGHAEDLTEDLSGLACGEGKGDVESQDQP